MPKQKGLVPPLRFSEFCDTGPWEVKQIEDVAKKITQGGTPKTSVAKYWNGEIPWITPAEMGEDAAHHYTERTIRSISVEGLQNSSAELLPVNSVIISSRAPIGYVTINKVEMATNQGCKGIVPKPEIYHEFLYFSLLVASKRLNDLGAGAGFKEISTSTLKAFQIPVPKLPEQQKIADCLSSLDDLIQAEEKALEALKQHKKGLMQQLFPAPGKTTPKLRFPEFRNAGPWEVKKVGEVFKVTRGNVLATCLISENISDETPYPVYSSQTKNDGLLGYYSDHLYEDSITWTTDGANAGDVKFRRGKFYCTNVCGVLINKEGYANTFVAELLNSVTKGYVSYVGNPKLMNGVMAQIEIPLPRIEEQQKIADCLSSLDDLIQAKSKRIEALKRHKKGLLQNLFPREIV